MASYPENLKLICVASRSKDQRGKDKFTFETDGITLDQIKEIVFKMPSGWSIEYFYFNPGETFIHDSSGLYMTVYQVDGHYYYRGGNHGRGTDIRNTTKGEVAEQIFVNVHAGENFLHIFAPRFFTQNHPNEPEG